MSRPIEHLDISQTGLLSVSFNNHVQVWKDFIKQKQTAPYMIYDLPNGGRIESVKFCPFEDVLGIGHDTVRFIEFDWLFWLNMGFVRRVFIQS